ncbi:MAG: hypothetical protein KJ697_04110 [Nanoarchaeota archaeon]|nr:hypothetical protein [Nanoarchaeota archaeon]
MVNEHNQKTEKLLKTNEVDPAEIIRKTLEEFRKKREKQFRLEYDKDYLHNMINLHVKIEERLKNMLTQLNTKDFEITEIKRIPGKVIRGVPRDKDIDENYIDNLTFNHLIHIAYFSNLISHEAFKSFRTLNKKRNRMAHHNEEALVKEDIDKIAEEAKDFLENEINLKTIQLFNEIAQKIIKERKQTK